MPLTPKTLKALMRGSRQTLANNEVYVTTVIDATLAFAALHASGMLPLEPRDVDVMRKKLADCGFDACVINDLLGPP